MPDHAKEEFTSLELRVRALEESQAFVEREVESLREQLLDVDRRARALQTRIEGLEEGWRQRDQAQEDKSDGTQPEQTSGEE